MHIDTDLRQRVVEGIAALLPGILRRELPAVTESARLMDELGLRSTTTLELLLGLEEDLDIQIDIDDIEQENLTTVGDVADFVVAHVGSAG